MFMSLSSTVDDLLFSCQSFSNVANTGCSNADCIDFNEDYKDKLFIETTVDEFVFKGWKHGVLRWLIDNKWSAFGKYMPPQIKQENGFAVFNGKNDTAENE
jgi:hypothetical protein